MDPFHSLDNLKNQFASIVFFVGIPKFAMSGTEL